MGGCVGINFNPVAKKNNYQWGHSLLEITISLCIASILIVGGFQWLQIVKREWIEKKKQISQNNIIRNVYLYLAQDFEMCKYLGLRAKDSGYPLRLHLVDNHVLYQYQLLPKVGLFYKSVSGFTSPFACNAVLPDLLCRRLAPESDVLIIHLIGKNAAELQEDLVRNNDALNTRESHHIHKGSLVLISDLHQGDMFIANDVSSRRIYHQQSSAGNQHDYLSKNYQRDASIIELQNVAYYLSGTSLYRDDFLHPAQEMVMDIETFKVEYGVKEASKVVFKKGGEVDDNDWKFIQSVRIKIKTLYKKEHIEFEFAIPNRYSFIINLGIDCPYFAYCESFIFTSCLKS